jgi:hypothetical protein
MSQQAVSADNIPNSAVGIFSLNTKGTKTKQLGYTYKLVTSQILKLKNSYKLVTSQILKLKNSKSS